MTGKDNGASSSTHCGDGVPQRATAPRGALRSAKVEPGPGNETLVPRGAQAQLPALLGVGGTAQRDRTCGTWPPTAAHMPRAAASSPVQSLI